MPYPPEPPQITNIPASCPPPAGGMMDDILASMRAPSMPLEDIPDCPIAPRELPPGTRLRGYCLQRVLGAGGFGVTYLAVDEKTQREVVIKENFPERLCVREARTNNVLLIDKEHREEYPHVIANFMRELRVLSAIAHPNMARIYSYFEAHYTIYFVSQYIKGMSLGELMLEYASQGRTLTQEEVYGALVRLLDALDYLHSQRLVHCDIKPDNILIDDRGEPMLIDFGATHEMDAPVTSLRVETPGFSAPEQGSLQAQLGPWTDLYALGATFAYMLTGEVLPPSQQRAMHDTTDPLATQPRLLALYQPRLLASIDRATRPAAHERYYSAAQWLADLRG